MGFEREWVQNMAESLMCGAGSCGKSGAKDAAARGWNWSCGAGGLPYVPLMTRMLATRSWKPWAHRLGTSSSTISIFRPLKAGFSNRCSLWSGPSWGQSLRVSGPHTQNRKIESPHPSSRDTPELSKTGKRAGQISSHQSLPRERETEAQRGPQDSCPASPLLG